MCKQYNIYIWFIKTKWDFSHSQSIVNKEYILLTYEVNSYNKWNKKWLNNPKMEKEQKNQDKNEKQKTTVPTKLCTPLVWVANILKVISKFQIKNYCFSFQMVLR